MPAKTAKQRRLMGAALAVKRGAQGFPMARKVAASMTESDLREFAGNPRMNRRRMLTSLGHKMTRKGM